MEKVAIHADLLLDECFLEQEGTLETRATDPGNNKSRSVASSASSNVLPSTNAQSSECVIFVSASS